MLLAGSCAHSHLECRSAYAPSLVHCLLPASGTDAARGLGVAFAVEVLLLLCAACQCCAPSCRKIERDSASSSAAGIACHSVLVRTADADLVTFGNLASDAPDLRIQVFDNCMAQGSVVHTTQVTEANTRRPTC